MKQSFKNNLFKKVADKLGIKHHFLIPYHSQSNGILEKFHSFLKACIEKHIHGKLDWEDTVQHYLFSFRILLGIHSKESPIFLHFVRDPLTPLRKLLTPYIRYLGDERGLSDLEAVRYAPAPARKNICPN